MAARVGVAEQDVGHRRAPSYPIQPSIAHSPSPRCSRPPAAAQKNDDGGLPTRRSRWRVVPLPRSVSCRDPQMRIGPAHGSSARCAETSRTCRRGARPRQPRQSASRFAGSESDRVAPPVIAVCVHALGEHDSRGRPAYTSPSSTFTVWRGMLNSAQPRDIRVGADHGKRAEICG